MNIESGRKDSGGGELSNWERILSEVDADYFWKRKFFIIVNVFIFSVLAAVVSLIMPKTFKADTSILLSTTQSGFNLLSSLESLPIDYFNIGGESPEILTYLAILKSRTVRENVVNKLNLIEYFDADNMSEAIISLADIVGIEVEEEGTIRVSAKTVTGWLAGDADEQRVKKLAADIANQFVYELDLVHKNLKSESARNNRVFIEKRYEKTLEELHRSEERLKEFQEKYSTISLPEQIQAAIEIAAQLKGEILAKEVELEVLNSSMNQESFKIIVIKKELEELKYQLNRMENSGALEATTDRLFPAFAKIPDLGMQSLRLQRDVTVQNTLFTFLTQQYEEAKIQEAKDTPTVQMLDKAVPPVKRSSPKRAVMVLTTALSITILSIVYLILIKLTK